MTEEECRRNFYAGRTCPGREDNLDECKSCWSWQHRDLDDDYPYSEGDEE